MVDRTREQLLGYLLGALEESERKSVETRLEKDPELVRELARLRERLHLLWVAQSDFLPPPGLAARTCRLVASQARPSSAGGPGAESRHPRPAVPEAEPVNLGPPTGGWGNYSGWLDVTVAVGLLLTVFLLVFPAIQDSRFNARLTTCQEHLRRLGLALTQYSEQHVGYFPPVYDQGKLAGAGIYAPILWSYGLVEDPRLFVCPGSPLADRGEFRVPLLEELLAAQPGVELAQLRGKMGGSFGYSLGFFEDGRFYSTRNLRRPYFALMADAPSLFPAGYQSLNHDGRGQNVLFEDLRIVFYRTSRPHARADDVFVNEMNLVAAGRNPRDSVIGSSAAVPCRCGRSDCSGVRP